MGVANAVLVDLVEKQLFGLELMKSGNLATDLISRKEGMGIQDVAWRVSYIENLDCLLPRPNNNKIRLFLEEFPDPKLLLLRFRDNTIIHSQGLLHKEESYK